MALNGGAIIRCINPATPSRTPPHHHLLFPSPSSRSLHVAYAAKKLTGRFDSKRRRSLVTTTKDQDEEEADRREQRTVRIQDEEGGELDGLNNAVAGGGGGDAVAVPMPGLPGQEPDFLEGPQWDTLGFFVQYLWAFGIVFALIACGIAVATYNEGATDFKNTPVYKESIQSRELLEEPDASTSEVFESNPTEVAPALE